MAPSHDSVEEQIRQAIERGEFDDLPGSGRRLDLGEDGPAWWARRKVKEMRCREEALELAPRIAALEGRIWSLPTEDGVITRVAAINDEIETANSRLPSADRFDSLDPDEVVRTWRRMYRLRT